MRERKASTQIPCRFAWPICVRWCMAFKMTYADYVIIFKALSDETRLKIVELLCDGELCACKILENFHFTQPTLSYHMKSLCDSGLVEGKREGAWMRYSLNYEKLELVKNYFNNMKLVTTNTQNDNCANG